MTILASSPMVSVILPIFNRRRFLPTAFESIRAQQIDAIEIVVVDDGSSDDSQRLVSDIAVSFPHPVRYIYQHNQGAYGARNTGIAQARGTYIAFYDSDDVWLPVHLTKCVSALDRHPDVDWVYSASEIVDMDSGVSLAPNCFYRDRIPKPFMRLAHETRGDLNVITDSGAIRCQILSGLYCGFQNSVIRRRVFDAVRLEAASRNEAEDQLFAIRALAAGFRLAYFDAVHVRYNVHADNSSGAAKHANLDKRRHLFEQLIAGYERLPAQIALTPIERTALRRRVSQELFWQLGYNVHWSAGNREAALRTYSRALRIWPWRLASLKTYGIALIKTHLAIGARRAAR